MELDPGPGPSRPTRRRHFTGEHGVFDCDDVLAGRPVKVRFEWLAEHPAPRWQQSFSYDGGATWRLNWAMHFTRVDAVSTN